MYTTVSMYLQQEVEEDGSASVEREGADSRHGGDPSEEEGSRLGEGREDQAGSHVA